MNAGDRLGVALLLESDGPGGAERMLLQLASELRRCGHEVCPVGPARGCGWLAAEFRRRGFEPEFFHLRASLDPLCLAGLIRILRRRRVDVIHSHEFTMIVYGAAASAWTGLPQVATMHGGEGWALRRRRRLALAWAARRSGAVVTVSESTRTRLAELLGLSREQIRVIPNGIEWTRGDGNRVRREVGIREEEVLLLAVGNLYPVKGHDVLLRALTILRDQYANPAWQLVVAGRGGEEARLASLARELGLADRVRLLGFREDVADLLAACDIFVLPSRSEGMPLALLEAMLSAKAIAASHVGGIPEAVEDGREALLVPPESPEALAAALACLISTGGLRQKLGEAARRRAGRQYTAAAMAKQYKELYVRALQS